MAAAAVSAGRRPASRALARRRFADGRIRTAGFAYLFVAVAYIQPVAYRHTYPTLRQRLEFARSFGSNKAVVLFYGKAYDLLTVGGYSAWRFGGIAVIFTAVWGVLAAVRALAAEEESGRMELVLVGRLGRGAVFAATLAAIATGTVVLWLAGFLGSVAASLPVAGSAYLALAAVSVAPVFVGIGAIASQLAPTRRVATELGIAVVVIAFVLRVIADTSASLGWLRWATPLGWAEELRPFTGEQPLVLVLPVAVGVLLSAVAARISAGRDIGSGPLSGRDAAAPRFALLSSPTAFALRAERTTLTVWALSIAAFAWIVGVISKSITSAGISKQLDQEFAKLGAGSILTPTGYIGFAFIFFVLAMSLFVVGQIAAARTEEASERLETILALPIGRRQWLAGRVGLALAAAAVISLLAGLLAWAGAASQGVSVTLPKMLGAGLNCLPVAILFLGLAALAYATVPRSSTGISYALVAVTFLWQLFGSLLGAPKWLVDATPFQHVGAVPARAFQAGSAAAMIGVGVAAMICALAAFERRDVLGA